MSGQEIFFPLHDGPRSVNARVRNFKNWTGLNNSIWEIYTKSKAKETSWKTSVDQRPPENVLFALALSLQGDEVYLYNFSMQYRHIAWETSDENKEIH